MSGDLDLPYGPVGGDPIPLDLEGAHMCGGVVVRAAYTETPIGKLPMLVFTFARADGAGFLQPIALLVQDEKRLVDLVRDAAAGAVQAAAS